MSLEQPERRAQVARNEQLEAAAGETLAEIAYRSLRADIIAGVRRPDERLRIERLRAIYGIGPSPMREALQRLAAEGLVHAEGNRGFAVASLDLAEFADLNVARTALEIQSLHLSLRRGDDDWEARFVAAAWRMRKADAALAEDAATLEAWERANAAFHLAAVEACGSQWLLRVRALLHDQCARYRRAAVDIHRRDRNLAAEHANIAEAVLARDVERAADLTKKHFERTAADLAR